MSYRSSLPFALALAFGLGLTATVDAADTKSKARLSLSNLSLEIAALETLHRFEMTSQQLEMLRKLAAETAPKESNRKDGKGSARLQQTLIDLREALLRGEDDRIDTLSEQLDTLLEAKDTDLDDEVEITPAARRRASEILQSMTARQIGAFLNNLPEELPDPVERLLVALNVADKLKDAEWKELVQDIVEDLSWQLGGLDPERSRFVGDKVSQYLKTVRSLGATELKKQRPDLEKGARQFVGQVPPTVVLHNVVEHHLAELLSNPRLAAALDARLKK